MADRVTAIQIGENDDVALGFARLLAESGPEPDMRSLSRKDGIDLGTRIVEEANAASERRLPSFRVH